MVGRTHTIGCVPRVRDFRLDGEPVVTVGGWVPLVEFSELVQAAQGEVVKRLFGPVLMVRIVEPSDEVEDVASFLDAAHNLVNVVLLALFDVVGFP